MGEGIKDMGNKKEEGNCCHEMLKLSSSSGKKRGV